MNSTTSTEEKSDNKLCQNNVLLGIIKDISADPSSCISPKLKGRVNRIIAECDLKSYSGLHKLNTTDENTSVLLGFMSKTNTELSYDEQAELNQAIINNIQNKLPKFNAELQKLTHQLGINAICKQNNIEELKDSLDQKLDQLHRQENEKVELMMEWLNHRIQDVTKFNDNSSDMLNLKTKILDLKSKILHLQILQNIFSETNQSIRAYRDVHTDLKESIKETEKRIKHYKEIIRNDSA